MIKKVIIIINYHIVHFLYLIYDNYLLFICRWKWNKEKMIDDDKKSKKKGKKEKKRKKKFDRVDYRKKKAN